MRLNTRRPVSGDIRTVTMFLLFPKTINGETRWLEHADIKQEWRPNYTGSEWADIKWEN